MHAGMQSMWALVNCERISDVVPVLVSHALLLCKSADPPDPPTFACSRNHTHATRERGYAVIAVPDLTPLICGRDSSRSLLL